MAAKNVQTDELNAAAKDVIKSWVKDGTKAEEPVTVSTPVAAEGQVPTPQLAEIVEAVKAGELKEVVPTATEVTPEPDAITAPVEATPVETEVKWFVGRNADGTEYKVPETFEIPITVDGEVSWVQIGETQKGVMRQADYTRKTTAVARARDEAVAAKAEYMLNQKKLQAQRDLMDAERDQLLEAAGDEEKFEALVKRMQDPQYKTLLGEAAMGRQMAAEAKIAQEAAQIKATDDATIAVIGWIDAFSNDPRFRGVVDPERLKVLYGNALHAGTAQISERSVEQFFMDEAAAVNRVTGGSEKYDAKIAEMQAKLDALTANNQAAHIVQRESAPNVAPGGGLPRSPAANREPQIKQVLAEDRQAAIERWKRAR